MISKDIWQKRSKTFMLLKQTFCYWVEKSNWEDLAKRNEIQSTNYLG